MGGTIGRGGGGGTNKKPVMFAARVCTVLECNLQMTCLATDDEQRVGIYIRGI